MCRDAVPGDISDLAELHVTTWNAYGWRSVRTLLDRVGVNGRSVMPDCGPFRLLTLLAGGRVLDDGPAESRTTAIGVAEGDPGYEFHRVLDAAFLSDGRIAVLDWGSRQVPGRMPYSEASGTGWAWNAWSCCP